MDTRLIIQPNMTLIEALRYMDTIEKKLLVICEDDRFVGVISIGDIQRAILSKADLSDRVDKYIRNDMIFAHESDELEKIKKMMLQDRIESMPVVDDADRLVNIIKWEDIFEGKKSSITKKIDYPVVIMAGGKGTRLKPITNIIPKPLIPISQKTIIEEIMDQFLAVGANNFYLSVNYKADVIERYFENLDNKSYDIHFIKEDEPLGTAGALYYLRDKLKTPFFVSNCDILVDLNLEDLVDYHQKNGNIATVVSVIKEYKIPYGTLETAKKGLLIDLKEKPVETYQINSGLYFISPEVFEYMKEKEYLDITDLLKRLVQEKRKVGVLPVSEGSWTDMGNWHEYLKLVKENE